MRKCNTVLLAKEKKELLTILADRFIKHGERHAHLHWVDIEKQLKAKPVCLWALAQMEKTGGEPDVIEFDKKTGEFCFVDCAAESPKERRSVCYDQSALEARKENKPAASAEMLALEMGATLITEKVYRMLQTRGEFDLKTSSWIATPSAIRKLGGALFCDRRYDTVFVYHNGADSYYAARGFRTMLLV